VLGHILATLRYLGSLPMLVRSLEGLHARIEGGQRDMVERLRDAHAALQESDRRQAEYGVAVASGIRNLEAANAALREHAAAAAGRIAALQASQLALRKWTAAFGEGLIAERRSGMEFRRELLQASRMMLESVEQLETFAARIERRAGIARTEPDLDEFYARFEDRFRGTPEDIRSRLQVYVPTVEAAVRGAGDAPVLDLGCGRGEWLELLRERGIAASGADANAEMARRCRERGLDVEHRDAFAHLARLGDGHAGAVTAFHVIEHLPFERLVTLFDEALRVLRPGGAIVFETPNPENLIVGACNFWHDPTHVHPLPPEMVRFVAEARGFERAEILRLHPFPDWQHIAPGPHEGLRKRLNELLYGAQDYSVIAYKPRNGA
jgi:SAM-dependent methyltransferase